MNAARRTSVWRRTAISLGAACVLVLGCSMPVLRVAEAQGVSGTKNTLGFVVHSLDSAIYKSKFWDECPEGAALHPAELWWLGLSKDARKKLGGMQDLLSLDTQVAQRGPHGEDFCWKPTFFKDPPQRLATGPMSYGMNLDGTKDGRATAKTCKHEKFARSPDGEQSIDNQLYRVIGCIPGYRELGVIDGYGTQERKATGRGLILVEITGVDDPRNDNDVEVKFYRAVGQMPKAAAGQVLPFGSYTIDQDVNGEVRYGDSAHGKIVDGVLTTDPIDATLPSYGANSYYVLKLRDMRLKVTIAADGQTAQGTIAGYYDLEQWYHYLTNIEYLASIGGLNCPSVYDAVHRLADGYPDPKTGECTAISSAFNIEATAALIVHPKSVPDKVAEK